MSRQRMDVATRFTHERERPGGNPPLAAEQPASCSLLDWFAGMALSGLVARGCTVDHAVVTAYRIAEAMLKARG